MGRKSYYSNTSAYDESIRSLRTNIKFSEVDRKLQSLVVTSSNPSEGKSTITVELARSFALMGERVLVIDCDLRNPTVGKLIDCNNSQGITNLLTGSLTLDQVLLKDSKLKNLHYLLSGPIPPNPSELLGSRSMQNLLDSLKGNYDLILIDTAPSNVVSDTSILATKVDGIVFVVNHGQTKKAELSSALRSIEQVGGNVIGVVLNKVPMKSKQYGYGRYY
ncbi:MAG: CpsD/CapB family tyrosine-protein kinase [Hoylesella buccalis]